MDASNNFEKYHGLGNDFVVVDVSDTALDVEQMCATESWRAHVMAVCDRHRGVGADGVILCDRRGLSGGVRMIIFNQDGSRPQMCGNGVRCVMAWAFRHGLVKDDVLDVYSDAGLRRCEFGGVDADGVVMTHVGMGEALEKRFDDVELDGELFSLWRVNMGNPHAVVLDTMPPLDEVDRYGVYANAVRECFEEGVNLEFVSYDDAREEYDVVVYERGVGRTQACGTGACAVAVALWESGIEDVESEVRIRLPGGGLGVYLRGQEVWMFGPAVHVFDGRCSWPWEA